MRRMMIKIKIKKIICNDESNEIVLLLLLLDKKE